MPPKLKRLPPLSAISKDVWKQLYDVAFRVRELAPWEFLEEVDLFGIQPADAKDPAFISVMGAMGEHCAVAVYPSVFSLSRFWDLQNDSVGYPRPEALFEMPHLQLAFGELEELDSAEKKLIRSLGHAPRGEQAWPYFRSFRPGRAPWFIVPSEVELLLTAMEQVLDVAPRYLAADGYADEDEPVWMRIQHGTGPDAVWTDEHRKYPYEPLTLNCRYSMEALEAVYGLPRSDIQLEVDVPMLYTRIGKRHERPQFPYLFLMADADTQLVWNADMLTMDSTVYDFWEDIPRRLLAVLRKRQIHPSHLIVKSYWMENLLVPICDELDIELVLTHELPALRAVQEYMEHRL